ncbi:MAG TPA: FG-GAP repeat protein [Hydrogenophaga sp.]|uniref:FG-GAP repeat protein n=1 Tax=Hydrogenophaga sp. TaxID=1904254 RepID=UPI002C284AAF|nr:FG-GAP repeat protein [Hydrogenophaga sp.]HSX93219.1 FG-GAP repeat protein [Hydrogenophaga sp.]
MAVKEQGMPTVRRSMRWFAAAMAVVYLSACGGGVDEPADGGGTGGGSNATPSPSPSPSPAPGGGPPPPPPSSPPPPAAPPPSGSPPASPPPGSGTGPIPDPGTGSGTPAIALTITSVAQRGLKLDWPTVAGASQYRIERDVDATDGTDNFLEVAQSAGPSISFTNLSLVEAMNHKYRVTACGASGCDLAAGTAMVTGDLAGSIVSANQAVDDGSQGRVMATGKRGTTHVLAVGMPGFNGERGMVLVYERAQDSASWSVLPTTLLRSTGVPAEGGSVLDHFGASVALSPNGEWLAVGMPGDDAPTDEDGVNPPLAGTATGVDGSGGVRVYRHFNGAWSIVARIKAPNARKDDAFGASVAISNEGRLLVGAPNEDGGSSGDVYLSGAIDSTVLDNKTAEDRGAVYAYAISGDLYSFRAYVKPPVLQQNPTYACFGVALSADQSAQRVAVGAPCGSYNGSGAGGVFVYDMDWIWSGGAKPAPVQIGFAPPTLRDLSMSPNPGPSSAAYRGFGGAVSMAPQGDWLAVGYPDKSHEPTDGSIARSAAGEVTVYRHQGAQWSQHSVLLAPAPRAADRFGISVSMVNPNGPRLLVGVLEDDSDHIGLRRAADFVNEGGTGGSNTGAAYYFVENPDPTKPMLRKARLKGPRSVSHQHLGRATAITRDGSEMLLSGQYVDGPNGSSAIFFGY